MRFVVDTTLPAEIVFNAKGLVGLAQEVRTLLDTPVGTVPLDREFGINWNIVDSPVTEAMPLYVAEVATKIERYIPRVTVESVNLRRPQSEAVEGILRPVVACAVRKEYLHEFV